MRSTKTHPGGNKCSLEMMITLLKHIVLHWLYGHKWRWGQSPLAFFKTQQQFVNLLFAFPMEACYVSNWFSPTPSGPQWEEHFLRVVDGESFGPHGFGEVCLKFTNAAFGAQLSLHISRLCILWHVVLGLLETLLYKRAGKRKRAAGEEQCEGCGDDEGDQEEQEGEEDNQAWCFARA